KHLCDLLQVRAYTRLAKRSYKKVGKQFTRLVTDAALTNNWAGMKSLYDHACGTTPPVEKLWLVDVDIQNKATEKLALRLTELGVMLVAIPSKKGLHYIVKPFDVRQFETFKADLKLTKDHVDLHKDNPTNLYIPDHAA